MKKRLIPGLGEEVYKMSVGYVVQESKETIKY